MPTRAVSSDCAAMASAVTVGYLRHVASSRLLLDRLFTLQTITLL